MGVQSVITIMYETMVTLVTPPSSMYVTSVYEQLHQGKIICATVAVNNVLLTAGDSTVSVTMRWCKCDHVLCVGVTRCCV